ncbi:MAG: hypothetical protein PHQ98_02245 [Candidatus ainarchaeum sp.]|nr:hypothetical protein [Candidatus ainarchaeum sp.]
MRKMILVLIILMISSMVFAGDYSSTTQEITIPIVKGWNLVPMINSYGDQSGCYDLIQSMFYYSTINKQYVGKYGLSSSNSNLGTFFPNESIFTKIINEEFNWGNKDNPYYGVIELGAMWIYSTGNCQSKAKYGSNWIDSSMNIQEILDKKQLKAGWNFIQLSPWMIGKELKDILKNCSVLNANVWDSQKQNWSFTNSTQGISFATQSWGYSINEAGIGTPIVVKVSNDCILNSDNATVTAPPALPN